MNMGKRSEIMTAESVGPGVGLRTGGAKNHRPFNVFLAQPNSNPVSRSLFLPGDLSDGRFPEFLLSYSFPFYLFC